MNIALIIAGGSGERMHQDIPKQFLSINDRPVIVYTLEAFEHHPEIDEIAVVCIEGWEQVLMAYARIGFQYGNAIHTSFPSDQ
jgi:2-C-methyl-D-erythritol 4-phosphate cytidylyltransferase